MKEKEGEENIGKTSRKKALMKKASVMKMKKNDREVTEVTVKNVARKIRKTAVVDEMKEGNLELRVLTMKARVMNTTKESERMVTEEIGKGNVFLKGKKTKIGQTEEKERNV